MNINLNEPNVYNQKLHYVSNDGKVDCIGEYFDFIPREDEYLEIESTLYKVLGIRYDFDIETIIVSLKYDGIGYKER